MDRPLIYPGAIPYETDLLNTAKNGMVAVAKVCAAAFGTSTQVSGLACTQTLVPSLAVSVGPGEIYSLQNVDGSAYSSVAADAVHQIVKQGVSLDAVTLAITPPSTGGYSQVYLVQAAFSEIDTGSAVLPYYNASNPALPFSGPANSGASQPTVRAGRVTIQAKAGTAAATGTQVAPSPDVGFVGLWAVTVANGASTVTSSNIAQVSGAPFLNSTMLGTAPTLLAAPTGGDNSLRVSPTAWVNTAIATAVAAAVAALTPATNPVGTVLMGYFPSAPSGYLLAQGQLVSRTTYAALWAYVSGATLTVSEATWSAGSQGLFSAGDGSTTFRLPDLRGEFLRATDSGRGVDSGRTLGSRQADALQNITGSIGIDDSQSGTVSGAFALGSSNGAGVQQSGTGFQANFDASLVARTATETRPRSVALAGAIKF